MHAQSTLWEHVPTAKAAAAASDLLDATLPQQQRPHPQGPKAHPGTAAKEQRQQQQQLLALSSLRRWDSSEQWVVCCHDIPI